jgi:RES domain-containing protein
MSHAIWRIATDTAHYMADDLSGTGAKLSGGRWNRKGTAMLYCAENIALACLETVVHLGGGGLPMNRYLVRIEVPDSAWAAALMLDAGTAPVGWDALPAGLASLEFGTAWAASGASALLLVPSTIVPEERVVLINPLHPDAAGITATKVRRWLYDGRLRTQG